MDIVQKAVPKYGGNTPKSITARWMISGLVSK
jgi:hypothetical protein